MNTFTVLCVYDMTLDLLKSNGKMFMKWLSEQFWRYCSCMSSFNETADTEVTASITCFSLCSKQKCEIESRLLYTRSNHSYECKTLINLLYAASSRTHLVLQAHCLTDVDEINPLGIEIWYRTTRRFSILNGIETIRSVPKKYRTRYPALSRTKRTGC